MIYLAHHGIKGQKWGKRNGPPYPLKGGDYSEAERKALRGQTFKENTEYNKKHYDKTIEKGTVLSTLTRDPNRLKNAEMYYAAYKPLDKHQYNAFFNQKVEEPIYDEKGNEIGTGHFFKYRVDSKAVKNLKVASEDSAIKTFTDLYKNNRDFYNYVRDDDRIQKIFNESRGDRYVFKAYREGLAALDNVKMSDKPSYDDLSKVYRLFNYSIPYASNNASLSSDARNQRAKFFNQLKKRGYSAIIDSNDAQYNRFNASAPVIVFDMSSVVPEEAKRTTLGSVAYSRFVSAGRKALNL